MFDSAANQLYSNSSYETRLCPPEPTYPPQRIQSGSSEIRHEVPWPQRLSRSSLYSWRLSRNTLEPDALAVFEPLVHEPPKLPLEITPTDDKEPALLVDEKTLQYTDDEAVSPKHYDRDLKTRTLCIMAVISGFGMSVASLAVGISIIMAGKQLLPQWLKGKYISLANTDYPFPILPDPSFQQNYLSDHKVYSMPQAGMILSSLALNTALTIIFEAMNHIPSTTLRWSLQREGRLDYNCNPRLFTGARQFAPNSRITNAVSAMALVLGYGAVSVLTWSVYIAGTATMESSIGSDQVSGGRWALDINAWGFVGLGTSLLLQSVICTWCLVAGQRLKLVQTWSSNPLSTARAIARMKRDGIVQKSSHFESQRKQETLNTADSEGTFWTDPALVESPSPLSMYLESQSTTLHSPLQDVDSTLAFPQSHQPAANNSVQKARQLTYLIWSVFAIVSIWTIVIGVVGHRNHTCTRAYVLKTTYRADISSYIQSYCQVNVPYYLDPFFDRRDWLGLIITSCVLALTTLGLHCVELLTEITRDEAIWRRLATDGANPDAGAMIEGATAWQCWVLFAFKCAAPWIFGYAFQANLFVFMNVIPLCVLALTFFLVAVFAEFLIRHKPKGPQPATYGNIAALIALVDDWDHKRLFWGDKGALTDGIRKAGTAGQRLADLDPYYRYKGLKYD